MVISQLITNIPTFNDQSEEDGKNSEVPDSQFLKAVRYLKALPPATVQAAKVGLDPLTPSAVVGPISPTGPLTVAIPDAPPKIQSESGWSGAKRESVITSLVPSHKTESVPPPPPPKPPRRHESVLVSAQANQTGSMPECTVGSRARVNPVLKRTSSISDCDVQSSSKRQHMSYAWQKERRATKPPAQLQPESPTLDEPKKTPDEQFHLIMTRGSSVSSPPANSPLHSVARRCSEPCAQSPVSPALNSDFITPPDFQPTPGNFTVKINQTLVHSPNPSSPIAPMMYVPLVTAGTPSPSPQSPAHSSSMLEFSPAHLLSSAHSPSSQLPTQVTSFSIGVGHGSPLDSFGPPGSHSPPHFTSISSFGLGRYSNIMDAGETTSMLSPGDSFSTLGMLDTETADLLAGNTSMLFPSTGS